MNVICGLPRSGSTLLCNLLAQNPGLCVSGTSILPSLVSTLSIQLSASPEIRAALFSDKQGTEERLLTATRAFVQAWYATDRVIVDKSRGWSTQSPLFFQLFPKGAMLVCVRDLRAVFASIEKEHRKFPLLDLDQGKTLYERADALFSRTGMIGGPIAGIEDLLRRKDERVMLVRYENFVTSPVQTLAAIYKKMGLPMFEHDVLNIPSVSPDNGMYDAAHLYKYPHNPRTKIDGPLKSEWAEYVSPDIAKMIMEKFKGYNEAFQYA